MAVIQVYHDGVNLISSDSNIHTEQRSPFAWQGISTTFSISAVMCFSGSFINCGGSDTMGVKSGENVNAMYYSIAFHATALNLC